MSQRIDVINYLTGLFSEIVPETHYLKNKSKTVIYPYQTFTLTGETTHFSGQGFYIDIDIFNSSTSDVAIEKVLSEMMALFNDGPFYQLTDKFLAQIEYSADNDVPTGSDTLQRRNIRLYAKFDWRI